MAGTRSTGFAVTKNRQILHCSYRFCGRQSRRARNWIFHEGQPVCPYCQCDLAYELRNGMDKDEQEAEALRALGEISTAVALGLGVMADAMAQAVPAFVLAQSGVTRLSVLFQGVAGEDGQE